ncbi:MAG: carboxymuconolactone decarboxylase family protein [Trebonia sp.]
MDDKTMLETGTQTRREVLGAEHVKRSLAAGSDFGRPKELVTEYCWGAVWSRPGLDRKTRSMLNIAMLTELGRRHELAIHVRGAVTQEGGGRPG